MKKTAQNLNLIQRPRRNRLNSQLRNMLAETQLAPENFILPVFVADHKSPTEIKTMPGVFRHSLDSLYVEIEKAQSLGIYSFALFPVIPESLKNQQATESINPQSFAYESLRQIKKRFPESVLIADVALDPFSSDGHDGFVENGHIVNDRTVERLVEMALIQAESGADIVAPSDMMDGRVRALRQGLDQQGFQNTGIMAYSAKYASSFYGPFRDALDSAPRAGDKKTYQMDYRNKIEALREVALDIEEGADTVMVKPAFSYLDVIQSVKQKSKIPVAAYNVSGEYAMIKAAAQAGMLDEKKAMMEMLYSIRRAGADVILSYFAVQAAKELRHA